MPVRRPRGYIFCPARAARARGQVIPVVGGIRNVRKTGEYHVPLSVFRASIDLYHTTPLNVNVVNGLTEFPAGVRDLCQWDCDLCTYVRIPLYRGIWDLCYPEMVKGADRTRALRIMTVSVEISSRPRPRPEVVMGCM